MPRKPSKNKNRRSPALTQGERHLLLTGRPYPDGGGSWKDQGEPWVRPFMLSSPAGRPELQRLWIQHREEIMAEWTGKGLPWAARIFD